MVAPDEWDAAVVPSTPRETTVKVVPEIVTDIFSSDEV
jgi:hypothetical protein